MKTRYILATIFVIIISIHFVATGLAGSKSQVVTENFIIEKTVPALALQKTMDTADQLEPKRSIYSSTTIISFIVAVVGIVAFRRNTYS